MPIPDRLKGDPFWDKPTSFDELNAIAGTLPAPNLRALQLTPWEMLEAGLLFVANDNTIIEPTSGEGPRRQVLEDNSSAISLNASRISSSVVSRYTSTVGAVNEADTSVVKANRHPRDGIAEATLVGGSLANVPLVPALAGYTGYVAPCAVWADSADTYIFAFQDEDDAALQPATATPVDVDLKHANEIAPFGGTHGVAGDNSGPPPRTIWYRGIADNKALEVDISGGAGTEQVDIWYLYKYET